MGNLITTALTYSKENAFEYFIKPLFVDNDIREIVDVRLDIKSSEKLNLVDDLSEITKAWAQGTSFTSSTGVTITQRTLTVADLKAEVKQNGRAFAKFVGQELLKKGWEENDVSGTQFEALIAEVYMRAVKNDLNKVAFFGDTDLETLSSGVRTGTADEVYSVYDGFWTIIIDAFTAGDIPSGQRVTMSNGAVSQVDTITVTGTSGTANVTVAGVNYLATFDTDLTTTAANFVTSHATALLARNIVVTSSTADVVFTSAINGVPFGSVTVATTSGDLSATIVATTASAAVDALATDEALTTFNNMLDAAPAEMFQDESDLQFVVTRSMYDNYRKTITALNGSDEAYRTLLNGKSVLTFDGYPLIVRKDWDVVIANKLQDAYPHRALFYKKMNLVLGTDGQSDEMNIEAFYDKTTQENVWRAEYKAGTQYVHPNYIVAAY